MISIPTGNNMEMKMFFYSCPCCLAEIGAYIQRIRLNCFF